MYFIQTTSMFTKKTIMLIQRSKKLLDKFFIYIIQLRIAANRLILFIIQLIIVSYIMMQLVTVYEIIMIIQVSSRGGYCDEFESKSKITRALNPELIAPRKLNQTIIESIESNLEAFHLLISKNVLLNWRSNLICLIKIKSSWVLTI